MSKDGTFRRHIESAVLEAKKQCGWILRTFNTRQVTPLLTLWKSLVQSKLEYCSQLWCPLATSNIQEIEMVQRSFLRKLSGTRQLTCWKQLHNLKLYSLERRTGRYRIIYVWRILEGQAPNITKRDGQTNQITAQWHIRRGRECMVPKVPINVPRAIQRLRYASLPVHGHQLFNMLPAEVRNTTGCTVDCFKKKLDKYLRAVPQIPGYTVQRRAETNSVLDMARIATAHH